MSENPLPPQEFHFFDPERQEIRVVVVHPPKRRYWVHVLLFALTLLSTLCIGSKLQYNFNNNLPAFGADDFFPWKWALSDWHRLALGIPFATSLLGILTAHELGHYVLCLRRKVFATLPFFIPAPTLIGTLGAFIRIKSPIRNRTDLFDIGIAGPIAGFVVAVPVLFVALLLSRPLTEQTANSELTLGLPWIFGLAHHLLASLGSQAPAALISPDKLYLHPVGVAAWVGMFATALNLLPGGQLDGGHIVFGLNPRWHRRVSFITIAALLPLSWFFSATWLLWAVVLRLTIGHPQVPQYPELDTKRKLLAVFALIMLVLTFAYAPLPGTGIHDIIEQYRHPSQ